MSKLNNSVAKLKDALQTALANQAQTWWQQRGIMAHALYPLACLTGLVVKHKQNAAAKGKAWVAPVPVIVIGNIYVGGTGKTPVVIACAKALCNMGWKPGVVSRGYGVNIGSRPRVTTGLERHPDPDMFGDEPALIAQESGCPIAVHPRRRLAIESMLAMHPEIDVIISDDGLQHVEMGRDVEILVQDGRGVGNGWLLPAGPLREPVKRLQEVDAIITRISATPANTSLDVHDTPQVSIDDAATSTACATGKTETRHISMSLEPVQFRQVLTGRTLSVSAMKDLCRGKKLAAAAGIGVPQRFFDTLSGMGLRMEWTRSLPDHAKQDTYTFAEAKSDLILMTSKDAIKCRSIKDERLWALEVRPRFMDRSHVGPGEADFFTWLDQRLRDVAAKKSKQAQASPNSM